MKKRILILGYGNSSAGDDGIGPRFADMMRETLPDYLNVGVTVDTAHMLSIDDSERVKDYDLVFFADASDDDEIEDYRVQPVNYSAKSQFSVHKTLPGSVIALCEELFNCKPDAYTIEIKGYRWGFENGISNHAQRNSEAAANHLTDLLRRE